MRPLLLPGLLDAARRNAAHGVGGLELFESAHVYHPRADGDAPTATPARERHHLGGLLCGGLPASWRGQPRLADYYAARAVVEGLLDGAGVDWRAEPVQRGFLHPGRAASVTAAGRELGWIGELHPAVAREWDLDACAAFELDADALWELVAAAGVAAYRELTPFPAVLQDIAVAIPEEVPAAAIGEAIAAGAGELLRSARVFDVYRGEQVGAGNRSLALRLEFRSSQRTLTDADVAQARGSIERALDGLGAKLRA